MTNSFYNPSGTPATGAFAASAAMRAEFDRIAAGFDKLPALTGTNLAVIVAGGVLTTTTGALVLSAAFTLSGGFGVTLSASADVTLTMPAVAGTLATLAGTETLSNKTLVAPALGTPASGNLSSCTGYPVGSVTGIDAAAETWLVTPSSTNLRAAVATTSTGSGALVFATSPTLATPVLGVATATSINKVAITAPASAATLTIADGKTLTVSNSLTFVGTDATVLTFPGTTATIARTDAAQTFTGVQTFSTPIATGSVATMTATVGGGVPTPPNDTAKFLRGDGTFAIPQTITTVYLTSLTASNSATLDDTTHITSTYDWYEFVFENIVPATDSTLLLFRVTKDGGSTFEASSYLSVDTSTNGVAMNVPYVSNSAVASNNMSNTAGVGISGTALFGNVNSAVKKMITMSGTVLLTGATVVAAVNAGGYWNGGTNVINGIRFLFNSGNISTGKIHIYGVRTS